MKSTTVDLEEDASVDEAVVPAESGQVDLRFDEESGTGHPPHEQALNSRLGPAREAIDEAGAGVRERRHQRLDLPPCEDSLVEG